MAGKRPRIKYEKVNYNIRKKPKYTEPDDLDHISSGKERVDDYEEAILKGKVEWD